MLSNMQCTSTRFVMSTRFFLLLIFPFFINTLLNMTYHLLHPLRPPSTNLFLPFSPSFPSTVNRQAVIGQNPAQKVVYDRNLQAIVDKLFPHFLQQVLATILYRLTNTKTSITIRLRL